jgi:DNA-binding MarR family transcriptional regulator
MSPNLQEEIQQTRPFASRQEEAFLNIARTNSLLQDAFERMLRPHGISITQYNVLRMLRGAEPEGLCRNEVRDRLLTRMPDVTRLLDRMEAAGLVNRERSSADRRLVSTQLTAAGRKLVDSLDAAAEQEHMVLLSHMSDGQLKKLVELLTLARKFAEPG